MSIPAVYIGIYLPDFRVCVTQKTEDRIEKGKR